MWNDELAELAQSYADNCDNKPNPNRNTATFTHDEVGESISFLPGATDYDKLVEIFNFDGNAYTFDPPNCISVSCDRYIQVSSIHLSST